MELVATINTARSHHIRLAQKGPLVGLCRPQLTVKDEPVEMVLDCFSHSKIRGFWAHKASPKSATESDHFFSMKSAVSYWNGSTQWMSHGKKTTKKGKSKLKKYFISAASVYHTGQYKPIWSGKHLSASKSAPLPTPTQQQWELLRGLVVHQHHPWRPPRVTMESSTKSPPGLLREYSKF